MVNKVAVGLPFHAAARSSEKCFWFVGTWLRNFEIFLKTRSFEESAAITTAERVDFKVWIEMNCELNKGIRLLGSPRNLSLFLTESIANSAQRKFALQFGCYRYCWSADVCFHQAWIHVPLRSTPFRFHLVIAETQKHLPVEKYAKSKADHNPTWLISVGALKFGRLDLLGVRRQWMKDVMRKWS